MNKNDLLKEIADSKRQQKPISKPVKKETKSKRKLSLSGGRQNREVHMPLDIFDDDDEFTILIKQTYNRKRIKPADLYNEFPGKQGTVYNLFYGLNTRSSMELKTFNMWCKLLHVQADFSVHDI